MARDMLNRELAVDDFVVFTNRIYQIKGFSISGHLAKIMLLHKSPSTSAVTKSCHQMCLLNADDMLIYMLTKKA